jgi:hypothetical protein
MAFQAYAEPETRCTVLPCGHSSLYIGSTAGGDLRRVATGEVAVFRSNYWSHDDAWLAYVSNGPPGVNQRAVRVARLDGTVTRVLGDVQAMCWIQAPPGP